ncbi:MAG: hypothetical protein IPL97_09485 [Niastella sp.]|nr:hypothetical protein [Niastella sp.]
MKQIFLFLFAVTSIFSCKKDKSSKCYSETGKGRIIGYHPCADFVQANKIYGAGFVIELDKATSKDTLVSFQIPEGLFSFKPEYIDGSYSSYLFKPEIQNLFKINFKYKIAGDNEKTNIICNGMVNTAWYDAAIRNREIFVSCISKQ